MKLIILFLSLYSYLAVASDDQNLNPFETDFCTGYVEGTHDEPDLWKHCCVEHDLFFWAGGSSEDRDETDLRLKQCVEATGSKATSILMYYAIRIGGKSPIKIKNKQWGNAWRHRAHYQKLSEVETAHLLHEVDTNDFKLSLEIKEKFKKQLHHRLEFQ
jgi:hypothetical protein